MRVAATATAANLAPLVPTISETLRTNKQSESVMYLSLIIRFCVNTLRVSAMLAFQSELVGGVELYTVAGNASTALIRAVSRP